MAGRIPESILEDILSKVDIVGIVGDSVALKKAGRNFKACCPFHHEKTPSFIVSPDKQIYHCFGCGESGNAFKFLMRHERMEFREAVEYLARKAGVELPQAQETGIPQVNAATELYAVLEAAAVFYAQALKSKEGENARAYLQQRGITQDTAVLLNLGFAPDRWDALIIALREKKYGLAAMEKAGLIVPKESGGYYDRFRNRLIFPIRDVRNRTIAFGARVLDKSLPKYINSPETPVYVKGRHFYGLNAAKDRIRETDSVAVVEGYLDFAIPYQEGHRAIAASLGTALTREQARLMKRYTQNVVMVYDADDAGQLASVRSLDIFIEEEMNVRVASLPEGFDPDTYVKAEGLRRFSALIESSQDLFDFKLRMLRKQFNERDLHGKAKIAAGMLETIVKIKNAVLKSEYLKKLARELQVSEDALICEARKIKVDAGRSDPEPAAGQLNAQKKSLPVGAIEKLLIKLMLEESGFINRVKGHLGPQDFPDERVSSIMAILFARAEEGKSTDASCIMEALGDDTIAQIVCESALECDTLHADHREKAVDDCIRRLKVQTLKNRREDLHEKIKQAHAAGDDASVRALMEEFQVLTKSKK